MGVGLVPPSSPPTAVQAEAEVHETAFKSAGFFEVGVG
jgi:hypothetical protein